MKKLLFLSLCASALVLAGCHGNNKKNTPSTAAKQYAENLKTGNCDGFVEYIYFDDAVPMDVQKQEKETYSKVIKSQAQPAMQAKGGLKDVQVVSENVAPDGKTADVTLKHTYNNNDTENVTYNMVKDNNNVWKVKVGKDKEVWKTQLPDGRTETFKLKETDDKAVVKDHIEGESRDFVKVKETDNKEVLKVKEDGEKDVVKIKDKGDEIVVKEKENGQKTVKHIDKEDL